MPEVNPFGPDKALYRAYVDAWNKAVGTPGYSKKFWRDDMYNHLLLLDANCPEFTPEEAKIAVENAVMILEILA